MLRQPARTHWYVLMAHHAGLIRAGRVHSDGRLLAQEALCGLRQLSWTIHVAPAKTCFSHEQLMLMLEQSMRLRSAPISFPRGCQAFSKMTPRRRFLPVEHQGRR